MHLSFQSLAGTGRRSRPPRSEVAWVVLAFCGAVRRGVVPLQPEVSRGSVADGECVTAFGTPQCLGAVV